MATTPMIRVEFNTIHSPLGVLLAAQNERGLCAVFLGDDKLTLIQALQSSFPQAHETTDNNQLNNHLNTILEHIKNPQSQCHIKLDIQGTPFNQQVWSALQAIPAGETRSYSDIAHAIGNPRAIRAVAHACATNNLSIVIPCHRVVSKNGSLAGCRWGIKRKRALLAKEKQAFPK